MNSEETYLQMQTPPPTRDASKRKPHQPPIRFTTPSTIKSRRQSAPTDPWLRTSLDQSALDSTPYQAPWSQFSPPDSLPFSSPGPSAFPTHPQANLFGDMDHSDDGFRGFTNQELSSASLGVNPFDTSPLPHKSRNHMPFSSPIKPTLKTMEDNHNTDPSLGNARSDRHSFSGASFVDPSKLWSDGGAQAGGIRISGPAARQPNEAATQPYQFHIDELHRKKEQQRRRRESTSRSSRTSLQGAPTTLHGRPGLQRSVTDSKARKSFMSGTSGDLGEITRGLAGTHIPRHDSPVKRQRLSGLPQTQTSAHTRKSVTLEVDEKGSARTVVRHVPERTNPQSSFLIDESDSEGETRPSERSKESPATVSQTQESEQGATPSSAQDALRNMIQQRKQRSRPAGDSCGFEDATTTATVGLSASAPFTTSAQNFNQITNCACGNNVPNALMIQW